MAIKVSDDWIVQLHIKETITKKTSLPVDFYLDGDKLVMTEDYHKRRGSCCGNGCLRCPYEPSATKGITTLKSSNT